MDTQLDTAQRRAEAIACEIHFLNIEHITERPRHCDDGYDGGCGGRDGECAVIKTANIVRVALAEARRDALEEAIALVDTIRPDVNGRVIFSRVLDVATKLDRLREGVERE